MLTVGTVVNGGLSPPQRIETEPRGASDIIGKNARRHRRHVNKNASDRVRHRLTSYSRVVFYENNYNKLLLIQYIVDEINWSAVPPCTHHIGQLHLILTIIIRIIIYYCIVFLFTNNTTRWPMRDILKVKHSLYGA